MNRLSTGAGEEVRLLLFLAVGVAASGCAAAAPIWFPSGRHIAYPPGEYIVAMGVSPHTRDEQNDLAQADSKARAGIAKQLQVRLEEVMSARQEEISKGSVRTGGFEVALQSKESVDLTLEGVRIVERFFDKKNETHYAFAALPRVSTSIRLLDEAGQAFRMSTRLSSEARSLVGAGDPAGAARKFLSACDAFEQAGGKEQIARVLGETGASPDRGANPLPALLEMAEKTTLKMAAGDDQRGVIGSPLPQPVRVQALHAGRTLVKGLPLSIDVPPGTATVESGVTTDDLGIATFRVTQVNKTGKSLGMVRVSVDWDGIVRETLGSRSQSWVGRLSSAPVSFKYRLRTASETRVLVQTCVSREGNVVQDNVLLPRLVDEIRKAGFQVLESANTLGNRTQCPRPEDLEALRGAYGGRSEILVLAVAGATPAGQRGEALIYRSHFVAIAYDLTRNEAMASLEGEGAGGGSTTERAADRSVRQATEDHAPVLAQKIAEGLR